jgi:acetyl esterase/lipase
LKGIFIMNGPKLFFASIIGALATAIAVPTCAADPAPTHADVSYGKHPHQLIDIYLPSKTQGPYPAVLWFGGIWKAAKHGARIDYFGNANCAVIAVETRTMNDAVEDKVSPPISYVANDAVRVVQFVRANAAKWGLDPKRIAVGGGSQGALPALFVACAGERADPQATDPVEQASSKVTCVAAFRCQPTIDPKRMQHWVPGVVWGAPALGCGFEDSLKRHDELLPLIKKWSPDWLLHKGVAPIYFENEWGLTQPEGIAETNYKVHSPAWAVGFQKLAQQAGVECYVKYPGHPTEKFKDIWDFVVQELKKEAP